MHLPLDRQVKKDHEQVRHLFREYWKAPTAEVRQQLGFHMIRVISQHASKEEETLYPLLGKVYGEEVRAHDLDDAIQLKKILAKMSSTSAYKHLETYDNLVKQVQDILEPHMRIEEQQLAQMAQDPTIDLMKYGQQWELASLHAVTRPHKWSPVRQPWDVMAKIIISPLDYMADFIRFAGYVPEIKVPASAGPSPAA